MIVEAYHLCGTDELAKLDAQAQQLMVKTRVAHWLDEYGGRKAQAQNSKVSTVAEAHGASGNQ